MKVQYLVTNGYVAKGLLSIVVNISSYIFTLFALVYPLGEVTTLAKHILLWTKYQGQYGPPV